MARLLQARKIVAAVGAALGIAAAFALLPGPSGVVAALSGLRGTGSAGVATFAALYTAATVALVPGGILQGAAGFLYGPVVGFLFAWPMGAITGSVSFVLGRTVLRDVVAARLSGRLGRLDRALAESGTLVVALLRISPLSPFNVFHYALGLTAVTWRQFFVGTLLGSIPPALLFVYIGSTVADLTELVDSDRATFGWPQGVGLALTLVATAGITAVARARLRRMHEEPEWTGTT